MNVHGFWSKANRANRKDRSVLRTQPQPPPGRLSPMHYADYETWRDHPDQVAVARALVAKCPLPEVKR